MIRPSRLPIVGTLFSRLFQSLELAAPIAALSIAGTVQAAIPDVTLQPWASGFENPVQIVQVPGLADRYFVLEQKGRIRLLKAGETNAGAVFLDIKDRVNFGGEKGLLGLAFHPDFKKNRRLFVDYTTGKDDKGLQTHLSEFKAAEDFASADPASEKVLLEFKQPYANHNGGLVMFGPDGFLYMGNGDGGSGNDPQGNGQKLDTLLGKILRIDVDKTSGDLPYAIPADNPFVGQKEARGEIFAYGLRNPWRWSFDRKTGELYAGDVGQNNWEEVDLIVKGGNYGWRIMEGFHCTPKIGTDCDQKGLLTPVVEYPRTDGVSVTGGFVYRGKKMPELDGVYLFGDYASRRIWGLRYANGHLDEKRELTVSPQAVSSFGEDLEGELFVVGYGGTIYRIVARP